MTIQNILRKKGGDVETISPAATLKTAIDRMKERTISSLIVVDRGDVVGIVSERDILRVLADREKAPTLLRVSEAMSRTMVTVAPDDSLNHAMKLMTQHRVRHLPVMSGGVLSGIVSIGDVVKDRLEELETETNVLRDVFIASH